jgi:hypothetical protein
MFAGVIFAVPGAILATISADHLRSGIPLMEGDKFHPGLHAAPPEELWLGIVGGIAMFVFGIIVIMSIANCFIGTDDHGLWATNILRRRRFNASWSEITALDRMNARKGSGYELKANGKTLQINSGTTGMNDLLAEIQKRAPSLSGERSSM